MSQPSQFTAAANPGAAPTPLQLRSGEPAAQGWALDPAVSHLNHGSFGAVPQVALRAQAALKAEMEANPVTWFSTLPERLQSARSTLASSLGLNATDVALVPNATAGATSVFHSLQLTPGSNVVVTDHGYGAVVMGAARMAERHGATVRTAQVPIDADATQSLSAILAAVDERTELIVVDQITSGSARHLPVGPLCAAARKRGIPILVDGAHAPGLLTSPLEGVDCDFWVGNLHKFTCAPRGSAVLVARGPHAQRIYPVIDSWGTPMPYPERFDHQGTLDQTAPLAAAHSIQFIEEQWGWDAMHTYVRQLADYGQTIISNAFSEAGNYNAWVTPGMPCLNMRLIALPNGLGATVDEANTLRAKAISEFQTELAFTSFRGVGYLRISSHAYNTAAEYERFAETVAPRLARWGA